MGNNMTDAEITKSYENLMEFLSLEKCDRTTDFREIYLNSKVALFLFYKDSCYFIVNEDITQYVISPNDIRKLTYPIYEGVYAIDRDMFSKMYDNITYKYKKNVPDSYRYCSASDAHKYLLGCLNGKVKWHTDYYHYDEIHKLHDYFWKPFFNKEKIKLNIDISYKIKNSFIRKIIRKFANKISDQIILKDIYKKYDMYKKDKEREELEIFNSNNPNKQSVFRLSRR